MRQWLQRFANHAEERDAAIAVTIPRRYTDSPIAFEQGQRNSALLGEIGNVCPVLRDNSLGVIEERNLFSDAKWHLSVE